MVKIGDYVTFNWVPGTEFTGLVLGVLDYRTDRRPKGIGNECDTYILYSIQILENDGQRNWYDVWEEQERDIIIHTDP